MVDHAIAEQRFHKNQHSLRCIRRVLPLPDDEERIRLRVVFETEPLHDAPNGAGKSRLRYDSPCQTSISDDAGEHADFE
jgi:hypothetical protein